MGRFSTTVQIKNNIDRSSFINSFCDVMKKRGFAPCVEDEAALAYALAFSEGGWVTLANEDYRDNPKKAQDDLKYLADGLKTSAFSVEVVDSDFAILSLNNGDTVIVGDGSGYGIEEPSRGNREYWEPILSDGRTWEQFSEIAQNDSVFVEAALSELAVILGISPELICAECSELSDNENVVQLYFKKAEAKSKPMTLNAAFKQVFGEALEPLGFKLIKSKYPYFVRVVPGGEIIHVITVMPEQGIMKNQKAFVICGGVATVYKGQINLTVNPCNLNWLIRNTDAYLKSYPGEKDFKLYEKINRFIYIPNDNSSLVKELTNAFNYTKQFLLPIINGVTNLYKCADFYWTFKPTMLSIHNEADWGKRHHNGENDSLMMLKIYDVSTYEIKLREQIESSRESTLHMINVGRSLYTQEMLDNEYKTHLNALKKLLNEYDVLLNNPERNKEVIDELEHRKSVNSETLRELGLSM